MMNTTRAMKISLAWVSIVWTICYLVVELIPGLGPTAWRYFFHMNMPVENVFAIGNFIIGLILWNVTVAAGVALAGLLCNYIKD